ncbi:MAG: hypothetical protein KA734_09600 [Fluviicola sp.]|nr:hypothetical protein [Fluviicola sp.]MBP6271510.1 hypothetical protein [Fluviicola sp.]
MRKKFVCALLFLQVIFPIVAQSDTSSVKDSLQPRISFAGTPIFAYDNDVGLRYGAVVNYFKYNDKRSKKFDENLFVRFSNSTKKSLQFQSLYETNNLLKQAKVIIEASYLNDKAYDFFGFNGDFINYHASLSPNRFYKINRTHFRLKFDYQRYINGPSFRLLAGLTFNKIGIDQQGDTTNLYSIYQSLNEIPLTELNGGIIGTAKLGIVFDSRSNQCYCKNGKWLESFVVYAPATKNSTQFSKFVLTFRTFDTLAHSSFVLTTRTSLQVKLHGEIPTYFKSNYFDSRQNIDGLGGAFTLRGLSRNRIVSDGFALVNLELRKLLTHFSIKKTQIDFNLSVFSDNGYIIQAHQSDFASASNLYPLVFNKKFNRFYASAGIGFYAVLNENNVISFNLGTPINQIEIKQTAFYVGSSFIF